MDKTTLFFMIAPIAIGGLIGAVVLFRFLIDRSLHTGGVILALVALVLILSPRVVKAAIDASGVKIDLDGAIQVQDSANKEFTTIAEQLEKRVTALEASLRSLPSPRVETLPGGTFKWDFGSNSKPQPVSDLCDTFPTLCTPDGKKINVAPNAEISWDVILGENANSESTKAAIERLKETTGKLENFKTAPVKTQ